MINRYACVAAVFLGVILLGYFFILKPKNAEVKKIDAQIQKLNAIVVDKHQRLKDMPVYQEKMAQMNDSLNLHLLQFATQETLPSLMETLIDKASKNEVQVEAFNPLPEDNKSTYSEIPVQLVLTGTYYNLAMLISDFIALEKMVKVVSFSIAPVQGSAPNGNETEKLSMNLVVNVYSDFRLLAKQEAALMVPLSLPVLPKLEEYHPYAYTLDSARSPFQLNEEGSLNPLKIVGAGDTISFNFQNILVRTVLQRLAEFTDQNVVISDKVQGNISLHLKNVRWDQALDFILKTQGLSKREIGNIIMIAPASDIAAQEQVDLQTKRYQINYGKVDDFYNLLQDPKQTLLSPRGRVVKLNSTNTLIVEDTTDKLQSISDLFKQMDVPAKQVLIEAKIVYVNTNYVHQLGVNWTSSGSGNIFKGFNMDLSPPGVPTGAPVPPGTTPATGIGKFTVGTTIGGVALNLTLQAIEAEGLGELVSSPRVLTSNNMAASIQEGQQIPYQNQAASGGTTIQFVQAVLNLSVTPQITPNNKLLLNLLVNQDTPDYTRTGQSGAPAINTRKLQTMIMVNDGQTVVLGGIYQRQDNVNDIRVPYLSKIPLIGNLFKQKTKSQTKSELLIFLTPKIIDTTHDDHDDSESNT